MRIKKLELVGFKSFKDRTVIHFDAGITGIVGPNGCGKSNIVDALVWVMGEMSAKHLRGSSMADVIFAGADGYAPMGMAEVSLTLENDGGPFPAKYIRHSEVMVTRRLHRSGETEYLINKEPARLRDIQEIFMDTGAGSKGFSIVEQGKIGEIITSKPEQRRTLIEEAAGITKFKVRKRESQRKLTSTDQNLVRLQDIIGEQKRQLDSLQRQAQRAERYRKIKDELQDKELWLSSRQFLQISEELSGYEESLKESHEGETSRNAKINEIESGLERLKTELAEIENQVTEEQTSHQAKQQVAQEKENEIRELKFEIEQARRDKEMTGSITKQYEVRRENLEGEKGQYQERQRTATEEADRLESEFTSLQSEYNGIQERIVKADNELTEKRREMLAVSQSKTHLEASLTHQVENIGEKEKVLGSQQEILGELKIKEDDFDRRYKRVVNDLEAERQLQLDIMKDVDNFAENLHALNGQVETKQSEVAEFKDGLNEVTSRLYGLEDLQANFEGFQEGVKNVMLWQRKRIEAMADGGTQETMEFQPVAELVEVPQEYELAMEAALGQKLQLLLSKDQDVALNAVDYLKEQKSGRSSFFSSGSSEESVAHSVDQVRSEKGVNQLLEDVVQVPEKFKGQVAHFLKDVVIVDSIRTALALRPRYEGMTFVTMEGDTLTADGILTGGSAEGADSGVLKRRREIKELSLQREEFSGKLSLAQASLSKLEDQQIAMNVELEAAREKNNEKEILIAQLKKDVERAENEFDNAKQAVSKQSDEVSAGEAQLTVLREKKSELESHIEENRSKLSNLESDVERLTLELETSRSGIDQMQDRVTRLQVESASKRQEVEGLTSQVNMVSDSLQEVLTEIERMSAESEKSEESLSSNQILIEQRKVEMERAIFEAQEAEKSLARARDQFEQIASQVRENEGEVSGLYRELNEFKSEMGEFQLKAEQLKMREQYLLDQINERYMLNLREEAPKHKDVEGDVEATEKDVEDLKSKLKRIGEVNLSAIEEYDDLSTRYEFLSKQHDDLIEAKEQLRKVIDRINRICSRRFKETFEQVNERFIKVFPVLFGGGEARLVLIEDPEKDEVGVDIVARPPGKKLQNVSLLSGGEKALTAVSLIFSIFLVKPSPYCLLDEVDAPLDDANVYRFNDLVKEMAKRSQIIVVTHNKYTMKVNNKLFGVTMEEKGVSKMVSVSLDEAEKVAEF